MQRNTQDGCTHFNHATTTCENSAQDYRNKKKHSAGMHTSVGKERSALVAATCWWAQPSAAAASERKVHASGNSPRDSKGLVQVALRRQAGDASSTKKQQTLAEGVGGNEMGFGFHQRTRSSCKQAPSEEEKRRGDRLAFRGHPWPSRWL